MKFYISNKESMFQIIRGIIAVVISGMTFMIVLIRACYSNIWYDEAFTYMYYVLPIVKNPSFSIIRNFWEDSLANNHWLNTLLIALFTKLSHIYWEEIIIRLPNIMFSLIYLIFLAYLFFKKKINLLLFILLSCNYYFIDYMRQARGYGMCAILVFFSIYFLENWRINKYENQSYLIWGLIFLMLSAYANSVALIPLFAYGLVILIRLIENKKLFDFIKKYWIFLIIYFIFSFIIIKYHFMISNIDNGKPLFKTENTSLPFIIKSYLSWIIPNYLVNIAFLAVIVILVISITYIIIKTHRFKCDSGLSMLLYVGCLVSMNLIFKRGGLLERTLLPGYTLVIIGTYNIIHDAYLLLLKSLTRENFKKFIRYILKLGTILLSLCLFINFINNIHPLESGYWKIVEFQDADKVDWTNKNDDPAEEFYKNKKEWNIQQLTPLK